MMQPLMMRQPWPRRMAHADKRSRGALHSVDPRDGSASIPWCSPGLDDLASVSASVTLTPLRDLNFSVVRSDRAGARQRIDANPARESELVRHRLSSCRCRQKGNDETSEVLHAWRGILSAGRPSLSIEITKECPLRCLDATHLTKHIWEGRSSSPALGLPREELVRRVLALADEYEPLHVSLVGGDPLVGYREWSRFCWAGGSGIHTQV